MKIVVHKKVSTPNSLLLYERERCSCHSSPTPKSFGFFLKAKMKFLTLSWEIKADPHPQVIPRTKGRGIKIKSSWLTFINRKLPYIEIFLGEKNTNMIDIGGQVILLLGCTICNSCLSVSKNHPGTQQIFFSVELIASTFA